MQLNILKIHHFKSHRTTNWPIKAKVNVVTGPNGSGKTNLLDAIHVLCLGKSYFSPLESQCLQWNEHFYRIEGIFETKHGKDKVVVKYDGRSKKIEVNDIHRKSIVDHIGHFPCTMIAPQDIDLVCGLSDVRRKLLDQTIAQIDEVYLNHLLKYNTLLKQRNALLKNQQWFDMTTLESIDQRLQIHGQWIFDRRKIFFEVYIPLFLEIYKELSSDRDTVDLSYYSPLMANTMDTLLKQNLKKDLLLQRTTEGIHRDDIKIILMDHPMSKNGSQGQIKTSVFALKLAQYQYLKRINGDDPILLLDDVFDKLDPGRMRSLIELLQRPEQFGQIFITDTYATRFRDILTAGYSDKICFEEIQHILSSGVS